MTASIRPARGRDLIVVRHAQAHCNVAGIVGGPLSCTGLTDLGHRQADHVAALLTSRLDGRPVHLYTSPRRRVTETAAAIANKLDISAIPVHHLRDPDCGDADGWLWDDVLTQANNNDDPNAPLLPGGETWAEHVRRVVRALTELLRIHAADTVVIVGHAETVYAAYHLFLDIPAGARMPMKLLVDNASITVWAAAIDAPTPPHRSWRLVVHNLA